MKKNHEAIKISTTRPVGACWTDGRIDEQTYPLIESLGSFRVNLVLEPERRENVEKGQPSVDQVVTLAHQLLNCDKQGSLVDQWNNHGYRVTRLH